MENIASSSRTTMDPDQTDPARPGYRADIASTSRPTVLYRLGPSRLRNMTAAVPTSQPNISSCASPVTPIGLDDDDEKEEAQEEDQEEEEEEEPSPIGEQLVKNTERVLREAKECALILRYTREEVAQCYDTIDFLTEKVSVLEYSFLGNSERALQQFYSEKLSKEYWTNKYNSGKTKIAQCLAQREFLKEKLKETQQELKVTKVLLHSKEREGPIDTFNRDQCLEQCEMLKEKLKETQQELKVTKVLLHSKEREGPIDTFNRDQCLEQCEMLKEKLKETEEELRISKDQQNSKEKEGPNKTCNLHLCEVLEEKLKITRAYLNPNEREGLNKILHNYDHSKQNEILSERLNKTQKELNFTRQQLNTKERKRHTHIFKLQQCSEQCELLREKLKETQMELNSTREKLNSRERANDPYNLQQCQECEKLKEELKETQKELKITRDDLKSKGRESSNDTNNQLRTELKYLTGANTRMQKEIESLRANQV